MATNKMNELEEIRKALNTLNEHKFVRLYNSTYKLLWFQFLKGLAFGLGSVLGATIVVSLLVSTLAQIEFVPIIGEWAKEIMVEIQQDVHTSTNIKTN
jgi:hypothetical protein